MHNLFCKKCRKSRYFCGRILARILGSRKVNEVFHVCFIFEVIFIPPPCYFAQHVLLLGLVYAWLSSSRSDDGLTVYPIQLAWGFDVAWQ